MAIHVIAALILGYLDSTMQCLIRTKPFSEAILELAPHKSTPLINGIRKTIQEFTGRSVATVGLVHELLADSDPLFTVGKMGDSFFALSKLISLAAAECKAVLSPNPADVFRHSLVNRCKRSVTSSAVPQLRGLFLEGERELCALCCYIAACEGDWGGV
eukprot:TRINITY_DN8293_c0_g1_i17.p1 TRINITY_DN8293_c0_g1~~TRINITY_DN8293_c0_g1_i17.p1  ORF type:complete len:159 (-),score=13.37 TRINITY_DN8293_c0_g1_i17:151-627(-)